MNYRGYEITESIPKGRYFRIIEKQSGDGWYTRTLKNAKHLIDSRIRYLNAARDWGSAKKLWSM